MTSHDLKVVERFRALVSEKAKVHEVMVFGSRARGDATEDSDLDVLVVVEEIDCVIEKHISESAWEAGFPEDVVIVPVAISLNTLRNSPIRESAFIRNVYHEGIRV